MGNSALRTIVTMSGRTLTFAGDEEDAYFRGLEAFHNNSPEFESFIRLHLGPGAHCLDVGANIGLTAALLATYCPNGRVYAFEASPKNARYLRENMTRNGLHNCVVLETAIGNRCGSLTFLESGFGAGSHVVSAPSGPAAGVRVVPVATLDSLFCAGQSAKRIDFMKLDVEGFEPVALSGAAQLIERDRCTIFMEFNSWCLQVLHEFNAFAFARALGTAFDLAAVGKDGGPQRIAPEDIHGFMYRNIMQHGCVDDIVLRLKDGASVPPLATMVKTAEDARNLRELTRLRSELKAARDARYFGLGGWLGAKDERGERQTMLAPAVDLEPTAPVESPAEAKNEHIQLLRAVAIMLVLLAHLSISNTLLMQLPFVASNPGWIGVELFFVISGFIVVQSFARARFSVGSFAIRRIFRLYPLIVFFLALTVGVKLACDALVTAPPPLFSPSLGVLYEQSLGILFAYHPTVQWGSSFANSALWSLSVELRFYAALAAFVAILNLLAPDRLNHRRNILLAACAVYATCMAARGLACFGIAFEAGDVLTSKMYDFIALGVIVAALPGSAAEPLARALRPTALALMTAAVVLVMAIGSPYQNHAQNPAAFNLAMIAVGLMFTLLIVFSAAADAPELSQGMRTFANFVGDRSYAIFLLHLPVFNIAWALGQYLGFDGGYWEWPLFQLAVSAILLPVLVEAAHRCVELPMIELGKSASERCRRIGDALVAQRPGSLPPVHMPQKARTRLEPAE